MTKGSIVFFSGPHSDRNMLIPIFNKDGTRFSGFGHVRATFYPLDTLDALDAAAHDMTLGETVLNAIPWPEEEKP